MLLSPHVNFVRVRRRRGTVAQTSIFPTFDPIPPKPLGSDNNQNYGHCQLIHIFSHEAMGHSESPDTPVWNHRSILDHESRCPVSRIGPQGQGGPTLRRSMYGDNAEKEEAGASSLPTWE